MVRAAVAVVVLAGAVALAAAGGSPRGAAPAARAPGPVRGRAGSQVVQPQPPAGSCHARGRGRYALPDPRCTPGAFDPRVTQADIGATICRRGYSAGVRPPESVTEPEKRAGLRAYGDRGPLHAFEYDHLISLELGGAPNDPRNLWPEPGASPNPKDGLEDRLHRLVCARALTLTAAQHAIARDWVAADRRYVG